MKPVIPKEDGSVNTYNLGNSRKQQAYIYYVNGIQTTGRVHAETAGLLSLLVQHPVRGVYNKSSGASKVGMAGDLLQAAFDYTQNASARLTFNRQLVPNKKIPRDQVVNTVMRTLKRSAIWNVATASLFSEVSINQYERILIVAHSQGNLITSNALFIVEQVFGSQALRNMRVYSLASPSPAWPLGLSHVNGGGGRQDNAHMNDPVALLRPHNLAGRLGNRSAQNAGDFPESSYRQNVTVDAHDVKKNMQLNFLQSIRDDLGYKSKISADFFQESVTKMEEAFKKSSK